MALNIANFATEIATEIDDEFGNDPAMDQAQLTKLSTALARAIVNHFVTNAELDSAALASDAVSGSIFIDPATHNLNDGQVDNANVDGGII